MPTLQFIPSIRETETVTCSRCHTLQYPKNGSCVRCHCSLGVDYVNLRILAPFDPRSKNQDEQLARWIGDLFRTLRKRRGICQSQLSKMAAGIDRSYLSKAENGHVLLPLSKLLPLAQALGLTAVILRFEVAGTRAVPKSRCGR
jgi:hypothetical protein